MAYILNIDTSSKNCSVALQDGNALISSYNIRIDKSASTLINLYCERILSDAGITSRNLSAIAVDIGPGSYTGLRIAVSTAKGLSLGLEIPLIALNTLETLAYSQIHLALHTDAYLCPMIDARRMEVYTCLLNNQLHILKNTQAMILDEKSFLDILAQNKVIFLGDGSSKLERLIKHPNAFFIPDVSPSAEFMINKTWSKFLNGQFADIAYLEPYYLKEFISTQKTLTQN